MLYAQSEALSGEHFRRLTGVRRDIFEHMVKILEEEAQLKRQRGGRKTKLCVADMLLMTLEYLREYRTYFHIAQN
jgi:Helix-turn-helix of DDE superfamily endonuclease